MLTVECDGQFLSYLLNPSLQAGTPGQSSLEMVETNLVGSQSGGAIISIYISPDFYFISSFSDSSTRSGSWVQATEGEVWPKPKYQNYQSDFFVIKPNNFKFEVGLFYIT